MGTRMTGMVFPFQGDIKEVKAIIYKWMQHEIEIIDSYTNIRIQSIDGNFILVDNAGYGVLRFASIDGIRLPQVCIAESARYDYFG